MVALGHYIFPNIYAVQFYNIWHKCERAIYTAHTRAVTIQVHDFTKKDTFSMIPIRVPVVSIYFRHIPKNWIVMIYAGN